MKRITWGGAAVLLMESVYAEEVAIRPDPVRQPLKIAGGVTAVAQRPRDKRIDSEAVASFDWMATWEAGAGSWTLYLEGNTTPRATGVSAVLPEANHDAGTALTDDGKGRLQISGLHYAYPLVTGELTLGLLNAPGFLDASAVANDEKSQFLATTLVNNPTIAFPDYAPGIAYRYEADAGPGLVLLLMGSHGLGDNPRASYAELLGLGDEGKGVFAAAEGYWQQGGWALRLGVWGQFAEYPRLDGGAGTEHNYGLYTSVDWPVGPGLLNLRLGVANDAVSKARDFAGVAYELPLSVATLGIGLSHTRVSNEGRAATEDDMTQAELYTRFALTERLHLTPAVQWLRNSHFDASGADFDADQTLIGVRVGYSF